MKTLSTIIFTLFARLKAKLAQLEGEAVEANIVPSRPAAEFGVPKIRGQSE